MVTNANIKPLCQTLLQKVLITVILVPEEHLSIINPGSHF